MTILQSYEHRIKLDFLLGISTDEGLRPDSLDRVSVAPFASSYCPSRQSFTVIWIRCI